jgi:hypothetical protein
LGQVFRFGVVALVVLEVVVGLVPTDANAL